MTYLAYGTITTGSPPRTRIKCNMDIAFLFDVTVRPLKTPAILILGIYK